MPIVYKDSLGNFHRNLSHVPDLLAGQEHLETYRKTAQYRSWQNSLSYISRELLLAQISQDCGVLIEFHLPSTSRRVDFIITGHNDDGTPSFVIVELKQWSDAEAVKDKPGVVKANVVSKVVEETSHPSYQAWSYKMFLDNMLDSVKKYDLHSVACACMHNYDYHGLNKDKLSVDPNEELVQETPIFGRFDGQALGEYIRKTVGRGHGMEIMERLADGKVVPSKGLVAAVCDMFDEVKEQSFTLIDEQKLAYETIMRAVRSTRLTDQTKRCVIVTGGPGTGKSVVAVSAFVDILKQYKDIAKKRNIRFVAPTSSFRTAITTVLSSGRKGKAEQQKQADRNFVKYLFCGSMGFFTPDPHEPKKNVYAEVNGELFCIICDEAHRLHNKQNMYRGENQIEDIIQAAKVSVFFVDDNQSLRPFDIGSVESIKAAAKKYSAEVEQVDLSAQFRCHGSDGFLNWLAVVLGLSDPDKNANAEGWNQDEFDFDVVDTPEEVIDFIRMKNQEPNTEPIKGKTVISKARLLAGYAWPWTKENNENGEVKDVDLGSVKLAWNNRKASYKWAIDQSEKSINEVGCVHTSQGLEFEWVGVFIGNDLHYDPEQKRLYADIDHYFDKGGKNGLGKTKKEREATVLRYICRCYRVLLSRGIKGARVYCCDENLARYLKQRLIKVKSDSLNG